MKKKDGLRWDSERLLSILLTGLVLLSVSRYVYDFWVLIQENYPSFTWILSVFGTLLLVIFEKAVESSLQKYNAQQEKKIKLYENIVDKYEEVPKKFLAINSKILDIQLQLKTLERQNQINEDSIIRLQSHIAILSTESIVGAMIYVQDQLGLLTTNIYRGEYNGEKKSIIILSDEQYEGFIVQEQKSGNLLKLQNNTMIEGDGDTTAPLKSPTND